MRVFRVETRDGRGICSATGSKICTLYRAACHDETEHCSFSRAEEDRGRAQRLWDRKDVVFAFPTMEALRTWFPQERGRRIMEDHGASGVIYEVSETIMSSKWQCVFDRSRAAKVGTFDLEKGEVS
jgi:hypothetical protein